MLQSKKIRWITALAVAVSLVWLVGLGWVVKDYLIGTDGGSALPSLSSEAETSAQQASDGAIRLVTLGDSLTRGTGDIEGKGYVGYTRDLLEKAGRKVSLSNLGIKGLTSIQLAEQIKEKEVARQIGQADVILMTIGGNDLFAGGQTLLNFSADEMDGLQQNYLANLKLVLAFIHEQNSSAKVYLLGLYNPFSDLNDGAELSAIVREWNNKTAEELAAYPNMIFVPTYDLFQQNVTDYLFTDHFHPNEKGYQLMAERVAALINGAGGAK